MLVTCNEDKQVVYTETWLKSSKEELNTATSFSVITDEASDFGHKEQVSVVFWYVDTDYVNSRKVGEHWMYR